MNDNNETKKAILLFSFGTADVRAGEKSFGAIESEVRAAFPNYGVYQTYTSPTVRKKLKAQSGITVYSPDEVLEKLSSDGYTDVLCQPTYFMNGYEYDDMLKTAEQFAGRFSSVSTGTPLISLPDSYDAFIGAMKSALTDTDSAYVMVGHGTAHEANAVYTALERRFHESGLKNVFIGTIESFPDYTSVVDELKPSGYSKVVLLPLLITAGLHAKEDIFGNDTSWRLKLISDGFIVDYISKGLGEYPEIQRLFVDSIIKTINSKENSK